jgi:hypothetical protein
MTWIIFTFLIAKEFMTRRFHYAYQTVYVKQSEPWGANLTSPIISFHIL